MAVEFNVVNDDVMLVPSDLLLLKHAGAFYGADSIVATELLNAKRCSKDELNLRPNTHIVIDTRSSITPSKVMFVGVPHLSEFGYGEMKAFAEYAMRILSLQDFQVRRLTTTIHGANYGLDAEESILNLVEGFQVGLALNDKLQIREISFVEKHPRRSMLLSEALRQKVQSRTRPVSSPSSDKSSTVTLGSESPNHSLPREAAAVDVQVAPKPKRHVFVAMPFSEDFEDVYEYGIYTPVRNCGLICEKTNETAFTGDILHRIKDRIETADLVVADLTGARPNVYLEVGYAWGKGIPVIFIARHGEQLHFDVSRHRCIYYRSIRQLGKDLEKLIRGILELGNDRAD